MGRGLLFGTMECSRFDCADGRTTLWLYPEALNYTL